MAKGIDETGNIYGKWKVIEKVNNPKKNGALFRCRCECGHEQEILGKRLRAGETKQCTTCQAKNHIKNYSGYKFNMLTVLNEYESRNGRIYWHCRCDCGNDTWVSVGNLVSNEVKSCGCLSGKCNRPLEDLTNQVFFDLTVLGESELSPINGRRYWDCQCICGNKTIVKTSDLTSEKVKSCGCRKIAPIHIGAVYGLLTVVEATEKRGSNGSIIYKCKCECGNYCEVPSSNLMRGDWKSCGCGRNLSYGEKAIADLLTTFNIEFERNKHFDDLTPIFRTLRNTNRGRPPEFDFYVTYNNEKYIIEYDGSQHFIPAISGWSSVDKVKSTHHSDMIKNEYCFKNNIPIIRIPYEIKDIKIEDLLLKTSKYILTEQNQNEYYNKRQKHIELDFI